MTRATTDPVTMAHGMGWEMVVVFMWCVFTVLAAGGARPSPDSATGDFLQLSVVRLALGPGHMAVVELLDLVDALPPLPMTSIEVLTPSDAVSTSPPHVV